MFENAKSLAKKATAGAAGLAVSGMALAQEASSTISQKIEQAGTEIVGYATAVVGIMVGFWAVKRAGQKMGWW